MQYHIVRAYSAEEMIGEVQSLLDRGLKLYGGLCTNGQGLIMQAMTYEVPIKPAKKAAKKTTKKIPKKTTKKPTNE